MVEVERHHARGAGLPGGRLLGGCRVLDGLNFNMSLTSGEVRLFVPLAPSLHPTIWTLRVTHKRANQHSVALKICTEQAVHT